MKCQLDPRQKLSDNLKKEEAFQHEIIKSSIKFIVWHIVLYLFRHAF